MANIWKPTQAECNLIREMAKRAAGTGGVKLEPGIRCTTVEGSDRPNSLNIALVDDHAGFEDSDLSDFATWEQFRKGVPLTEDGRAVVDFYVHDRVELNTNIVVYFQGGQIVEVHGVGSSYNMLRNGLHYVAPVAAVEPVASAAPLIINMGGYDFVDFTAAPAFKAGYEAFSPDVTRVASPNPYLKWEDFTEWNNGYKAAKARHTGPEFAPVEAPALPIDALLYKGREMHADAKLERRIVANLIAYMMFNGWVVDSVDDGEERTPVGSMVAAMDLVFNLDECRVGFTKFVAGISPPFREHSVLLVLGNGVDCLADWGFSHDDADGFNSVMEKFDTEDYV